MKEEKKVLKVFTFSSILMDTELLALLGHKFTTLPFSIEYVNSIQDSSLVIWDGIITPKNKSYVDELMNHLGPSRRALILSDMKSLWVNHPRVQTITLNEYMDDLNAWTVLPEELLFTLENIYKKLAV